MGKTQVPIFYSYASIRHIHNLIFALVISIFLGTGVVYAQAEPGDSPYIYGLHDFPGNMSNLDNLLDRKGWVLLLMEISAGPAARNPIIDDLVRNGYGVIVRLHWTTGDREGTIPPPDLYDRFAENAKRTVENNPGCKYWIVGNEPNLCVEWPRGSGFVCNGRPTREITVENYADCYLRTYDKIHELDGSIPRLHVIPAPMAVWAGDQVPGAKDFLCYFARMVAQIPPEKIDALALHPKTHEHDPVLITSLAMSPPDFGCDHNERVYWEFRIYWDLMWRIPKELMDRKVFFTELNPHSLGGWRDINNGFNQEAFEEINRWNIGVLPESTGQTITSMIVYRWEGGEVQWRLDNKPNVQRDLREAAQRGYTWAK